MPYYAVRVGRKPGVYSSWDECKSQVDKYTGARYKKFPTEVEAWDFVNETNSSAGGSKRSLSESEVTTTKRLKSTSSCGADSGDFDGGVAVVYTDGSCVSNGQDGAKAGIGVYWGLHHPRNLSERLHGRQTNNRAEIYAATRAIQQAKEAGLTDLVIRTDSQFLIKCITSWVPNWKKKDWISSSGKPVINKEELVELDSELCSKINVKWEHVRGHVGVTGNEAADRLANEGAKLPQ